MKEKELEGRISELNRTLTEVKRRCNEERAELSFTVEDCERAKKRMAEKQKEIINVSCVVLRQFSLLIFILI